MLEIYYGFDDIPSSWKLILDQTARTGCIQPLTLTWMKNGGPDPYTFPFPYDILSNSVGEGGLRVLVSLRLCVQLQDECSYSFAFKRLLNSGGRLACIGLIEVYAYAFNSKMSVFIHLHSNAKCMTST